MYRKTSTCVKKNICYNLDQKKKLYIDYPSYGYTRLIT